MADQGTGAGTGTATSDRASTPLLALITQQSMDEDYQLVAERKADLPAATGGGRPRRIGAVVAVAAFGLLVTVAFVQTSEREGVESLSRTTLISRISDSKDNLSELQRQVVRLRELNVALQTRLDTVTGEQLDAEARVQRMGATTGFSAVTGPGVRVTVDDNPNGEAVRDVDLRPLVDGLWNAGAEAIAVNGLRLTARSAIRNSSLAIRINNRSMSPPYVVEAIGDTRTLQADLMQTSSGLTFRSVVENFGFPWSMDNVEELELPAAPPRMARLRSAVEGTAAQNTNEDRKEAPQ